uniref:heavy metal translocating P-type ATPase n=1 Tax=Aquibium sp. A9E412 TaxID=2976767 RepID=UPI00339D4683
MVAEFLRGRVGVDAIALVAMAAALVLGEPLAAVVVAIMYAGGNVLEEYARGRAEYNLKALTDRSPRIAHRFADGHVADVAVGEVRPGDRLLVRAGEVLPVDGALDQDAAVIDEAAVTGEPVPVARSRGEALRSGTVNAGEAFRMTATARAGESTYAAIVRMVEAAHGVKAPFIRMADRFAILLLPAALLVAGAAWLASGDPVRALAVLVVATPCPLILAAPVALIGGVSRAARRGVLMKGGAALEAMAQARTALFDKTGTLTEGGARLVAAATAPAWREEEVLRLVATLEQASHHVVAEALVAAARRRGLALSEPAAVEEVRGAGISGTIDGRRVQAGSRALVWPGERPLPGWAAAAADGQDHALVVFVAVDGALAGVLRMGDGLRPEAAATLAALRRAGIGRLVMVTGDDAQTARRIGGGLPLDHIAADLEPDEKVAAVKAETARAPTMMVGDGINDAPALAAAGVGVAMGARGATASSEAADVVVMIDRVDRVAEAYAIAVRSRAIALQSIVVGLVLSGIAMVVAAFGYITPVAGALLQEGIDVAVILNALRALGGPETAVAAPHGDTQKPGRDTGLEDAPPAAPARTR